MKFSILIPAFKDTFIKECIDSCLAQTYENFEIIVVNDNSPYNIEYIIKGYSDKRIRYYRNKEGYGAERIVDNWNHCLGYATGDFVLCIGDDDKLKQNCLEEYIHLINRHPNFDIYHMRMEIIDQDSNIITIQEDRPETETAYSMIWHFWHGRKQVIGDWCFNTKTLKEKGGFVYMPYGWSADNITAFKFATEKGIANARIPGFQYRETNLTITNRHTPETTKGKIEAWKQVRNWYNDYFKNNNPQNEVDTIYKNDLIKLLGRYYDRKIEGEIEDGLSDYPYSILAWLRIGQEVGIPRMYIIKKILRKIAKTII